MHLCGSGYGSRSATKQEETKECELDETGSGT